MKSSRYPNLTTGKTITIDMIQTFQAPSYKVCSTIQPNHKLVAMLGDSSCTQSSLSLYYVGCILNITGTVFEIFPL